jgi:hypothetical protein
MSAKEKEILEEEKNNQTFNALNNLMKQVRISTSANNAMNEFNRLSQQLIASRQEDITGPVKQFSRRLAGGSAKTDTKYRNLPLYNYLEALTGGIQEESESDEHSSQISEDDDM